MDLVKLTSEQRQAFDEDGFLVVPKALDGETVDRMVETGDRLMADFLNSDDEKYYAQSRQSIVQQEAFKPLISFSPTVPLIVQLLTPQIHLHTASLIYKKPRDPGNTPPERGWHRDIGTQEDLGHAGLHRVGVKVCYCLTDFHQPNSGMTLLARSSHLRDEALAISRGEADPPEMVDAILDAGDAILFENRTFHSAAPNLSDRVSKVIIFGYAYRWMRPDINLDLMDLSAPWLQELDDIDKQLLGADGYHDLINPPKALLEWAERHGVSPEPVPRVIEL